MADGAHAQPLVARGAEVRFSNVEFSYESKRQILFGVDFTIPAGTTTAVVGHSELAAKYPRNYLFKMEAADALVSQAEVDRTTNPDAAKKTESEAFAIFESLLASAQHPAPNAPRPPLDLVHYDYGNALLVAGQPDRAAKELLAAAAVPGAESSMVTRARLRAAQALDVAGKREEAITQYKAVLALPNVFDSHEDARRGLKEPYRLTRKSAENTGGEDARAEKTN